MSDFIRSLLNTDSVYSTGISIKYTIVLSKYLVKNNVLMYAILYIDTVFMRT